MAQWKPIALVCVAAFALAACGSTPTDRGLSGGAIGAASGAIAGALIPGLSVGTGAAIGAGVGVLSGVLTDERQLNLGKPVWQK